ncbi:MAG: 30S ribosomal protein S17 [Candidatus Omnitrophica bacterium]|nr:30S ribosomal protein S17 [Candidatus Omnitrophota bacterium]
MDPQRSPKRKERVGVVLSNKMDKTIVVRVARISRHPIYRKVVRSFIKVKAHDEARSAKVGDKVSIVETRPMSKEKNWRLKEVLTSSR